MFTSLLAAAWLLAAPPPEPKTEPTPPARAEAEDSEVLAEYNRLKDQTPNSADAQWKLALWCESKGLKAESLVHLAAVLKLDPKRAAAWQKLGFKKKGNRWVSDQQLQDEAKQAVQDKVWVARLRKWHAHVHGGPKQAVVQAEMAEVTDPTAVPAIYAVFGRRGATDQSLAVQLFGQIFSPEASKGLAVLAVYGANAEVRARATQTLRQRDSDDYLGLLTGLLTDILKYEIRAVGGPDSPGVLFVESEKYSVRRFYAPPLPPEFNVRPGDLVSFDEQGLPFVTRPVADLATRDAGGFQIKGVGRAEVAESITEFVRFGSGDIILQSQIGTRNANEQLRSDERDIQAFNRMRRDFNEHVLDVARDASGEDFGKDPDVWRLHAARKLGASEPDPKKPTKPIYDLVVPLASLPFMGESILVKRRYISSVDT